MFQELTGFIERLDSEEHGNWVIDKENDGSPEHPIQMPYVNYGREAIAFEDAVYKFVDEHPEYDMKNYREILEKAGIECETNSMEGVIVDDLDTSPSNYYDGDRYERLVDHGIAENVTADTKGSQRLFDHNRGLIYPDFISRDSEAREDICLIKHGFQIPTGIDEYGAFTEQMRCNEIKFLDGILTSVK